MEFHPLAIFVLALRASRKLKCDNEILLQRSAGVEDAKIPSDSAISLGIGVAVGFCYAFALLKSCGD